MVAGRDREAGRALTGAERSPGQPQSAELSDKSELDMPDRHELDDAVLELLGVPETERRRYRDALYVYLGEFFEATRQKEEHAIENKDATRQRRVKRPADVALEIVDEIAERHPTLLRSYEKGFLDPDAQFDTYEVPREGEPTASNTLFVPNGLTFGSGKKQETLAVQIPEQVPLLILLAEHGQRGYVRVPHAAHECKRLEDAFRAFVVERERVINTLIEDRTGDEALQRTIRNALDTILASRTVERRRARAS